MDKLPALEVELKAARALRWELTELLVSADLERNKLDERISDLEAQIQALCPPNVDCSAHQSQSP
jgi:hypothetical protein